jgi:hypothetical protein
VRENKVKGYSGFSFTVVTSTEEIAGFKINKRVKQRFERQYQMRQSYFWRGEE